MTPRIRYYTYKVTFIDLADYTSGGKNIPLFTDYVPLKRNAAEAQLEISSKTKRNLVFLSTVRAKQRKTSKISSVKVANLTKRQNHTVEKAIAPKPVYVVPPPIVTTFTAASSGTFNFTAPASTVNDTVTVTTSGGNTVFPPPFHLVIVPPGPVTEAPVDYDPQRDKMTERSEEDDRSVWDNAHPEPPVVSPQVESESQPTPGMFTVRDDVDWTESAVVAETPKKKSRVRCLIVLGVLLTLVAVGFWWLGVFPWK